MSAVKAFCDSSHCILIKAWIGLNIYMFPLLIHQYEKNTSAI
jgi:hypothetical protein